MKSDFASQVLITVILVPLIAGLSEFFKSQREKRHRFDEHRLDAYSAFAKGIAEVLWANNSTEAEARRAQAWISYEAIALTSTAEVVASAVRVRHAVSGWVDRMKEAEARGVVFGNQSNSTVSNTEQLQMFHAAHSNPVYKELGEFHRLARSNMGLKKLDHEQVDKEIRKYYDY